MQHAARTVGATQRVGGWLRGASFAGCSDAAAALTGGAHMSTKGTRREPSFWMPNSRVSSCVRDCCMRGSAAQQRRQGDAHMHLRPARATTRIARCSPVVMQHSTGVCCRGVRHRAPACWRSGSLLSSRAARRPCGTGPGTPSTPAETAAVKYISDPAAMSIVSADIEPNTADGLAG